VEPGTLPSSSPTERGRRVLVGRAVTVRPRNPLPTYFTQTHRRWIGASGRVHAVVPGDRENPLVKVGFEDGTRIVFFRLLDLEVDEQSPLHNVRHGRLPA
jgi:hypothetical protein